MIEQPGGAVADETLSVVTVALARPGRVAAEAKQASASATAWRQVFPAAALLLFSYPPGRPTPPPPPHFRWHMPSGGGCRLNG